MTIKTSFKMLAIASYTFLSTQGVAYTSKDLRRECDQLFVSNQVCIEQADLKVNFESLYKMCVELSEFDLTSNYGIHLYQAKLMMRNYLNKEGRHFDERISAATNFFDLINLIFEQAAELQETLEYKWLCGGALENERLPYLRYLIAPVLILVPTIVYMIYEAKKNAKAQFNADWEAQNALESVSSDADANQDGEGQSPRFNLDFDAFSGGLRDRSSTPIGCIRPLDTKVLFVVTRQMEEQIVNWSFDESLSLDESFDGVSAQSLLSGENETLVDVNATVPQQDSQISSDIH